MKNYRFSEKEIESMKRRISAHIAYERTPDEYGNTSAWRLRTTLEGLAYCCALNKRERAAAVRNIALYETLTVENMPNFN
ncbi:MAG: hypothetical protein NC226_09480 [Bacteroides cellulosilyticus]|nr:hypothetical protein [Bacteroides cellulosilyticus]